MTDIVFDFKSIAEHMKDDSVKKEPSSGIKLNFDLSKVCQHCHGCGHDCYGNSCNFCGGCGESPNQ